MSYSLQMVENTTKSGSVGVSYSPTQSVALYSPIQLSVVHSKFDDCSYVMWLCVQVNRYRRLGSLVIRALDSRLDGREFDSRLRTATGWVTVFEWGNHLSNLLSHQLSLLYAQWDIGNEYQPKCGVAQQSRGVQVGIWLIPLADKRVGGR